MHADVLQRRIYGRHEGEHVARLLHPRHPLDEHRMQALRAQERREGDAGDARPGDEDAQAVVPLRVELLR